MTSSDQLRIMARILLATIYANELVPKPEPVRVAISAVVESIRALLDTVHRAEMDEALLSVKEPSNAPSNELKPVDKPKPKRKRLNDIPL